jgi:glycosyltransferase involved in cell wall biosynthesis
MAANCGALGPLGPGPNPVLQASSSNITSLAGASPRTQGRDTFVSCVIPGFNEAANLRRLLPMLADFLAQRFDRWEIVLVDDGSTDDTGRVIDEWAAQSANFQGLQFSRNFGKEAALSAGLEAARGDVVVQLDADLQHPPELIDQMVERWRAGADVVYAVRVDRSDEQVLKRLGVKLFYGMIQGTDRYEVPPNAGDFRLMDRQVVDALLRLPERNRFMKGLYAWVGFRAEGIPYTPAERASGKTSFNLLRLVRFSIDGITGFTTWPLRLVSLIGVALALLAFLYGGFLTVSYLLYGNEVPGWTTVVVGLLFFSGIQMISIGVLGEYVSRIFEEVKGRPLYLVRRHVIGRGEGERR